MFSCSRAAGRRPGQVCMFESSLCPPIIPATGAFGRFPPAASRIACCNTPGSLEAERHTGSGAARLWQRSVGGQHSRAAGVRSNPMPPKSGEDQATSELTSCSSPSRLLCAGGQDHHAAEDWGPRADGQRCAMPGLWPCLCCLLVRSQHAVCVTLRCLLVHSRALLSCGPAS